MLKNAIVFAFECTGEFDSNTLTKATQTLPFAPCGPTEAARHGWVPPRGIEHGPLVESITGQYLLKFKVEQKSVPRQVVAKRIDEVCKGIEDSTGRKPGRKQIKEIKEQVEHELLPSAFATSKQLLVWIDPKAKLIVVDAASRSACDNLITELVKAVDGLVIRGWQAAQSPSAVMTEWVKTNEPGEMFTIDRECELRACDESRAVVRYGRHSLTTDEIKNQIARGMIITKLAMTWSGRVSFVLDDSLKLAKIAFLDVVMESNKEAQNNADAFDADCAIMTGELSSMLPDLLQALGGEDTTTDPLYDKAVQIVRSTNTVSLQNLQSTLQIGYNRASRLIEAMQTRNVISEMAEDGTRTVIA